MKKYLKNQPLRKKASLASGFFSQAQYLRNKIEQPLESGCINEIKKSLDAILLDQLHELDGKGGKHRNQYHYAQQNKYAGYACKDQKYLIAEQSNKVGHEGGCE